MARQKPVRVIRKSDAAPRRTARDIGREQAAARAAYSGGVQGYGIGFNGDLVNTPSGPVWVPHGTAPPADAYENRLAGDGLPQPQTQAQLDPNSNLYRYREQARANTEQTPPTPSPTDFPGTWSPNPGPTPIVPGYNDPNQANGPGPRPVTQPTNPFTGGMGPPAPGGAEPGPGPNAPGAGPGAPGGPNNPFDPGVGPPAPGTPIGIPNQPGQLQGLLAAYGYTTGPNGELLPIHLRQGMSPFQNQPGQQSHPPYTLPGFGGGGGQGDAQPFQGDGPKIGAQSSGNPGGRSRPPIPYSGGAQMAPSNPWTWSDGFYGIGPQHANAPVPFGPLPPYYGYPQG